MSGRLGKGFLLSLVASLALILFGTVSTASAADTFADVSRANDSGDCLTPATACKTISGVDGAIAKASSGSTVHVLPGTYAENVTLPGGISLVADSGNPTIGPSMGIPVNVTGGPAATIDGLTLSSDAAGQPLLRLQDGAGSMVVSDNTFVDPTPTNGDNQVGIRTSAQGSPQITGNTFTSLMNGIQVIAPQSGTPGHPAISNNTITGLHDNGAGIFVSDFNAGTSTGTMMATITKNTIENASPAPNQQTGITIIDAAGFFSPPVTEPPVSVTMARNKISTVTTGISSIAPRGGLKLNGDILFDTDFTALQSSGSADSVPTVTVTNATIVDNANNIGISLQDSHLDLDSSILGEPIYSYASAPPNGPSTCTIRDSAGPPAPGLSDPSCENFETRSVPSFVNAEMGNYHLAPTGNTDFIDQGNPDPPVTPNDIDIDGDPRAIDFEAICPLNPVRDIGADELNPGIPNCPLLTVTVTGPGTVTGMGIACPGDCTQDYVDGTVVLLTPAPGANAMFDSWSGDCMGAGACSLTMSANRSVGAAFSAIPLVQPLPATTPSTAPTPTGKKRCKKGFKLKTIKRKGKKPKKKCVRIKKKKKR